jgi:hypothetical protein
MGRRKEEWGKGGVGRVNISFRAGAGARISCYQLLPLLPVTTSTISFRAGTGARLSCYQLLPALSLRCRRRSAYQLLPVTTSYYQHYQLRCRRRRAYQLLPVTTSYRELKPVIIRYSQ